MRLERLHHVRLLGGYLAGLDLLSRLKFGGSHGLVSLKSDYLYYTPPHVLLKARVYTRERSPRSSDS